MNDDFDKIRTTPEGIVSRIGNIANRSDIKYVQELQIKEIREYAASELDNLATNLSEVGELDQDDKIFNFVVKKIATIMHKRANLIREGK